MEKLKEKFFARLIKTNGCWLLKSKQKTGYISIYDGKTHIKAHRLSYIIHKGDITPGLFVCHTCDNPACVNPDHLWLGTCKENNLDCKQKGRYTRRFKPLSIDICKRAWTKLFLIGIRKNK